MKKTILPFAMLALTFGFACSSNNNRTAANDNGAASNTTAADRNTNANIDDHVKDSLKQANLNDVRVDLDKDKKVVTLAGNVKSDEEKSRAADIAKKDAEGYVVANEIAVRPEGDAGSTARKVDSKTDDAIKSNWKALEAKMHLQNQHINADVKEGVLTLKGDVDTNTQREKVEQAARHIPNVKQVVNELDVKNAAQ